MAILGTNHLTTIYLGPIRLILVPEKNQSNLIKIPVQHRRVDTLFKKTGIPLKDLVDPTKMISRPNDNSDDNRPSICNEILETLPLDEGTFHETALVTALGSGSKWIGSLIEMATGVQSFIAAFEG